VSSYEPASLCRATQTPLEALDAAIFSPGSHSLVDVEEYGQGAVTRPPLADNGINAL
jgi:hypothetical protein